MIEQGLHPAGVVDPGLAPVAAPPVVAEQLRPTREQFVAAGDTRGACLSAAETNRVFQVDPEALQALGAKVGIATNHEDIMDRAFRPIMHDATGGRGPAKQQIMSLYNRLFSPRANRLATEQLNKFHRSVAAKFSDEVGLIRLQEDAVDRPGKQPIHGRVNERLHNPPDVKTVEFAFMQPDGTIVIGYAPKEDIGKVVGYLTESAGYQVMPTTPKPSTLSPLNNIMNAAGLGERKTRGQLITNSTRAFARDHGVPGQRLRPRTVDAQAPIGSRPLQAARYLEDASFAGFGTLERIDGRIVPKGFDALTALRLPETTGKAAAAARAAIDLGPLVAKSTIVGKKPTRTIERMMTRDIFATNLVGLKLHQESMSAVAGGVEPGILEAMKSYVGEHGPADARTYGRVITVAAMQRKSLDASRVVADALAGHWPMPQEPSQNLKPKRLMAAQVRYKDDLAETMAKMPKRTWRAAEAMGGLVRAWLHEGDEPPTADLIRGINNPNLLPGKLRAHRVHETRDLTINAVNRGRKAFRFIASLIPEKAQPKPAATSK